MFKEGDRVKCINDSFKARHGICTLKRGKEYIVQSVKVCGCGSVDICVGAITQGDNVCWVCSGCGTEITPRGRVNEYFSAKRFVKAQEKPRVIKIKLEEKEPILN